MKNKNWDLLFVIIGLLNIIFSFVGDKTVKVIFGLEITVWTYRTIWAFIVVFSFLGYRKKKKLASEVKDKEK